MCQFEGKNVTNLTSGFIDNQLLPAKCFPNHTDLSSQDQDQDQDQHQHRRRLLKYVTCSHSLCQHSWHVKQIKQGFNLFDSYEMSWPGFHFRFKLALHTLSTLGREI